MNPLLDQWNDLLGVDVDPLDLTFRHMVLRAIVVFAATHVMLRLAHKRFFASRNAFDVLLTFILASTLSRAVNGASAFHPTLGVGFLLILLHAAMSRIGNHWHALGHWLKGTTVPLVTNGRVDEEAMRRHQVALSDLEQDLRLSRTPAIPAMVKSAVLERNGEISVIREPQVFTVRVEDGVQSIRIQVE